MTASSFRGCVIAVLIPLFSLSASASWQNIFTENFNADPSGTWSYSGVQNGSSQDLFRYNAGGGNLLAEWDQDNLYNAGTDPDTIQPSFYTASLGQTLTDTDSFRVRTKLRIDTFQNTTEFYQLASFGLYNLGQTGPDRTLAEPLVKDGSDFVEFSYFINNSFSGPNITATMAAHITGLDFDYTSGSDFTQTAMGVDNWLPTGTDLYAEVMYLAGNRTAYANIFTDAAYSSFLSVNGVEMSYVTDALPGDDTFSVTEVGFVNWVDVGFVTPDGQGTGSFDDITVDVIPEPGTVLFSIAGLALLAGARRRRHTR